ARRLLAEAGHPRGFDGGEFTIAPPYEGAGEAIAGNLAAVGIRMKIRTMERAAFFSGWREGKLKGVVFGGLGPAGNAASRLQILAVKGAPYAAGTLPEVQDLFERQARELDRKKREELLHQIQRLLSERAVYAPIWENGFIRGVGPRVDEPALALIPYFTDGPDGPRWTSRNGAAFGLAGGVGPSGQKYIPGMHYRADVMASTGLYEDGKKGIRRPTDPHLRIRDMERDGVQAEVIFGILGAATRLDDHEAAGEMFRIYNDWLVDFCRHYPERHIGLACLPYGDIGA